ncbi:MAG: hypothetical protein ACLPYS_13130 [Vulcanimicrobiaceae bacterium]
MLEGSRAFDITWGTLTAAACLVPAAIVLTRWFRRGLPSVFGAATDPRRRLEGAWGVFGMVMGSTNFGCRFVRHGHLPGVHEGYALITLTYLVVVGPPVARVVASWLRAPAVNGFLRRSA